MENNLYNILGLSDENKDVKFSLEKKKENMGYNIVVRSGKSQDKKIKEAYEKQYTRYLEQYQSEIKKIDDEYNQESKDLEEKYKKSIAAKRLGLKSMNNSKENTVEKIKIKMENEIKEYESEKQKLNDKYEKRRTEIVNKYKTLFEELEMVYNDELKTQELRNIYKNELDMQNIKKSRILSFETAYDFFGISEERINSFHPVKADEMLREEYKKRMETYEKALLDKTISFSKRKKIEALQMLCKQNYELISNSDNRTKYSEYLDYEELKEKYSKVSQFKPDLIFSDDSSKYYIYSEKTKKSEELLLKDNMSIKKVSTLVFKNSTGVMNSYINQYKVKRNVGNNEIIDYIYSDLDFQRLDIDENTGLPIDSEYYNCVVNELLSEEMLKASKFNSGYIGLVESTNDGNKGVKYRTTLQDKDLAQTEQEYLAAVMIYEKSHQNKNKSEEKERIEE